ncbi:hypothetical protein GJ496_011167 [Pomphorhynchus laevis]|nr:hypothetical protein GJ496_011167 [Pomphorhynchus laevis]
MSRHFIERKATPIKTKETFTDEASGGVHEDHRLLQSKTRKCADLISSKETIGAFISKLTLHKQNLARKIFVNFPTLDIVSNIKTDDDILIYTSYLTNLILHMNKRFAAFLAMEMPDWVVNPYDCIQHEQTIEVQDEVVNLQNDVLMRNKFSKLGQCAWFCHDIMEHYPILRSKLHMYMPSFPTTYLVEAGF